MSYKDIARFIIKRHEGLSLKPYHDIVGKLTIGYGRNLDDNGITQSEASHLLDADIKSAAEYVNRFNWDLTDMQRAAMVDMMYNLGYTRFLSFKKMIKALDEGDYKRAAKEMLDSKWAVQVGKRSDDLAEMMWD